MLRRDLLMMKGVKDSDLPDVIHITRPGEDERAAAPAKKVVRPRELAKLLGG